MGGTTFSCSGKGTNVDEVYKRLVENAYHEYGHGGYSGTIKEKDGYVVITNTPVPLAEAERIGEDLIERDDERITDKWGPAGAIPYYEPTESATRTVSVTVKPPVDARHFDHRTCEELVLAKVKLRDGEAITQIDLVRENHRSVELVEWRHVVEPTKGKTVTRYIVKGTGRTSEQGQHGTWETGFDLQSKAREYAIEAASRAGVNTPQTFEVEGVTRRDNGDPLVRVRRVRKKWEIPLTVTITKRVANATATGWYFFGWASC